MQRPRVLVVGTPTEFGDGSGEEGWGRGRNPRVTYERDPRAALDRLERRDDEFDYVVCTDVPEELVGRLDATAACPVLDRADGSDVPVERRIDRLVRSLASGGGVSLGTELSETVRQRAMDAAPVGVTIADAALSDTPLVYVNEGFEHITGYSTAEVVGRNCRFLQGPGTDPESVAAFTEAIERAEHRVVEILNYRKDGTPFWNRVELAPIEDQDGTVTHFVGFQTDVTARREAERTLKEEREDLETLLDRVNGLLGDVTAALMGAPTRSAVEHALVDRLADEASYRGAWVGTPDLATGRFETGAQAGIGSPPSATLDGDDPIAQAYASGDLVFEPDPSGEASHPTGGVVAVPLTYRETTYGVCCVYGEAADVGAFEEHERAVLRALGRAAATAIHAIEGRRLLGSDTVTELDLRLPEAFPAAVARRLDATFTYEGAVFEDEALRTFYTVSGASPAAVTAEAAREPAVRGCRAITEGEDVLFEFVVTPESLVPTLADRGAELRGGTVDASGVQVSLSLPVSADTRGFVESLRAAFGPVDLVATHERERPTRTTPEFREELESRLTDRQLTALRLAHVGGYFEPNRRATGDELAAAMGVSRSTFHQHLRAAQRKFVTGFFDPDEGT